MPILLKTMGQELRHRKVSLYLGGQRSSNLTSDLLSQVSMLFCFHLASKAEFDKLRELGFFRHISYDQVTRLAKRYALVGAVESTEPLLQQMVQKFWIRPTLIDAGGETLTA